MTSTADKSESREVMGEDENVFLMGEDVEVYGGALVFPWV